MINCTITSPKKTIIYKKIASIILPSSSGQMQILPGHAESFILLQKGNIFLQQSNNKKEIIENTKGECHIRNNIITIIL